MLRSVTDGSTFHPGLPRSVGTSYVCYVAIKFCYVYQVVSRNVGDEWCVNPNMPMVLRGGPQSCCKRYIMHPISKTSLHVMAMKKPISYLYNC